MLSGAIVKGFIAIMVVLMLAVGFFCWLSVRSSKNSEDEDSE